MSSCRTPEKKSKILRSSLGSFSPQTPTKIGVRRLQVKKEKDSCCLCCGINLYGAGSTYNLLSHDGLAKKISQLILQTIDVERQSCRICKSCFRRVETLDKKSSVLSLELECFRGKYSRNNPTESIRKTDTNLSSPTSHHESFVKRLAKIPLSSASRKRSKVCEKLFESGTEDSDLILMSVSPLNDENPQDKSPQDNGGTNSSFNSEVSYVFHRNSAKIM